MYTQVQKALAPCLGDIRCPHARHLISEITTEVIGMLAGNRYDITSGHHIVSRDSLRAIIAPHLATYSPAGAALNPGRLHED